MESPTISSHIMQADNARQVTVIHLADIHIGSKATRSAEYRAVFDELGRQLTNLLAANKTTTNNAKSEVMGAAHPSSSYCAAIAIIAGDIFHDKIRYSGQDVDDFNYLMAKLAPIPTLIIPGNHDANLAALSNTAANKIPDLISPLIDRWPHVTYVRDSGAIMFGGLHFYHISVFDLRSEAELVATAGQLAAANNNNPKHILLYHGTINGAQFNKHTVSGSRISSRLAGQFRAVIAGDIHQTQCWHVNSGGLNGSSGGSNGKEEVIDAAAATINKAEAVPIAYCGSLIQQNLGEDMCRGYMVWQIPTAAATPVPSPQFVQVLNSHGYIRLDLRGLDSQQAAQAIAAAPTPKVVAKISVLSDNDSVELRQQLAQVNAKFGRGADNIIQSYAGIKTNSTQDVLAALTDLLTKHNASPAHTEQILAIHRAAMTESRGGKWHLVRMDWDNLLSYGPGNSIDFTKLEGAISGVVAPNRAGKSSILDILTFGLFGHTLRGDMKSVRRDGATSAFVRVIFAVAGQRYSIERTEKSTNYGAVVRLMQEPDAAAATEPQPWLNISAVSSTQTYEKVKELIGGVQQFLSTALYYGGRDDIVEMSKGDRMTALTALFGGSHIKAIAKDTSAKLRQAELKLAALPKPRIPNPAATIAELQKQLDLAQANANPNSLEQLDAAISKLTSRRTRREVESDLARATTTEQKINMSIDETEAKINVAQPSSSTPARATPADYNAAAKQSRPEPTIAGELAETRTKLAVAESQAASAQAVIKSAANNAETIEKLRKRISAIKAKPRPAQLLVPVEPAALRQQAIDPATITSSISTLEAEAASLRPQDEQSNLVASLQARVDRLTQQTALSFSDDCGNCQANIAHLSGDLASARAELDKAKMLAAEARAANEVITARRQEISSELAELRQQRHAADAHARAIAVREKAIATNEANAAAAESAAREAAALQAQLTMMEVAAAAEASAAAVARDAISQVAAAAAAVTKLEQEAAAAAAISAARDTVAAAEQYRQYLLITERDSLLTKLHAVGDTIAALTAEAQLATDDDELAKLVAKRATARAAEQQTAAAIARIMAQLDTAQAELVVAEQRGKEEPELTNKITMYKLYLEILNKDGFLAAVIGRQVATVIDRANMLLAAVVPAVHNDDGENVLGAAQRAPPFRIRAEVTGKQIELFIDETANDLQTAIASRPVSLASGFQKFIISIAFRFALTMNLHASAEFMCIDEGFGCMDGDNLSRLVDLFAAITPLYRGIFIISHIPELNSMISHRLTIAVRQNPAATSHTKHYSYVNNADVTEVQPAANADIDKPAMVAQVPVGPIPTNELITCECGKSMRPRSMKAHIRSKFHVMFMRAKALAEQ